VTPTRHRGLDAAMGFLVIIWGVNFPIIKGAFGELPPFAFNGLRFAVAAAVLGAVLWRQKGIAFIHRPDLPGLALLGLIGHAGYQTMFIAGLARTSAGHSSIILSMVPLFVGVLGVVMRIERPTPRMWIGLVLAFLGVVILIRGRGSAGLYSATLIGDLLTMGGALCWAAYTVMSRPWLTRYSALHLTTVTLIIGLPVVLATAVPEALGVAWDRVGPQAWASLAFSAIFAIAVSYLIWYSSVQAVGSVRTAAFSNLIPVVTLLSAWAMLGEPLGLVQVAGTAVVLFGVWLARSGLLRTSPAGPRA
jgi:drug/metabolite transporter (DMT)-like permease